LVGVPIKWLCEVHGATIKMNYDKDKFVTPNLTISVPYARYLTKKQRHVWPVSSGSLEISDRNV